MTRNTKSSKTSAARRGYADSSEASPTATTKFSSAQIETMLRTNQWWPFDRVDGKILQKMHRATAKQTTDVEDALL